MPYISSKILKICPLFGQNMSPLKRKKPTLMAVEDTLDLLHSLADITCASPSERAKGNAATTYNDAADDDRDVGLTNRDGARHDNNLAEWDENKRWASKRGVHETACFFLSMPIGDENEIDTKAPSFLYSTCKKVKQLD